MGNTSKNNIRNTKEGNTNSNINSNTKNNVKDIKDRIFRIIQIGNKEDLISSAFDYFIVIVILVNLCVTLMFTFDELYQFDKILSVIELITIVIFTVEYILRLWTADLLYPQKSGFKAIITFVFSFYGLIDLLTFFPYYLPFFFPAGVVAFRMFRVVRIFRLFRINNQYDAFNVITTVIKSKSNQLISSIALIMIFMVAASLSMYSLEHNAQPEHFRNAFSGIWWSVSTLLTVGYGDIYPITPAGQFLAIIIAFLGVGMVAIPTGIISAGFVEVYNGMKEGASVLNNRNTPVEMNIDCNISEKKASDQSGQMPTNQEITVSGLTSGDISVEKDNDGKIIIKITQ